LHRLDLPRAELFVPHSRPGEVAITVEGQSHGRVPGLCRLCDDVGLLGLKIEDGDLPVVSDPGERLPVRAPRNALDISLVRIAKDRSEGFSFRFQATLWSRPGRSVFSGLKATLCTADPRPENHARGRYSWGDFHAGIRAFDVHRRTLHRLDATARRR
jgi:hypothetical protein